MAGRFSHSASSHELKLFAVVFVAVIGCAALVNLATQRGGTPGTGQPAALQTAKQNANARPRGTPEYIDQMALQAHGDWSKLSDEDQRLVNSVTAGHGAIYVRDRARYLEKERGGKRLTKAKNGEALTR